MNFVPCEMTHNQVREVNAMTHVENELIDQACGRVIEKISQRGWDNDTDIFFTTDHGELQGDFGLLFKGPYHVDALMRLPFIWQPARSAKVVPAHIDDPVGHLDLAPTFCQIAGVPVADWMQGTPLPVTPSSGRQRVRAFQFRDHLGSRAQASWQLCRTLRPQHHPPCAQPIDNSPSHERGPTSYGHRLRSAKDSA